MNFIFLCHILKSTVDFMSLLKISNIFFPQTMRQSDEDQAGEQALLPAQSAAEISTNTSVVFSGTEEEMKILEKEKTLGVGEVKEVDYASINYSLLHKKDGDKKPDKMENEYAEIQIKNQSEGEVVETLQDGVTQQKVSEVKQNGVDQGVEGGMESQNQVEVDEVQV